MNVECKYLLDSEYLCDKQSALQDFQIFFAIGKVYSKLPKMGDTRNMNKRSQTSNWGFVYTLKVTSKLLSNIREPFKNNPKTSMTTPTR